MNGILLAGNGYFRKTVEQMSENEEEIFCDSQSRMDMMERVYKGRMIPIMIVFLTIIIPQLILRSTFDSFLHQIIFGIYVVLLIVYIVVFV